MAESEGQIIAMGGGGFVADPDNLLLEEYILAACDAPEPRVCFIPTASGDSSAHVEKFYAAFNRLSCRPNHLILSRTGTNVLRPAEDADVFYVGGGNTRNLLVLWKEWRLSDVLREAWQRGAVLSGVSAGALCWFEEGVSDSFGPDLKPIRCLGLLRGSYCPHYDGEPERRPAFRGMVAAGRITDGYGVDDGAALHFVGQELQEIVSSRSGAGAYRVARRDDDAEEEALEATYLGEE